MTLPTFKTIICTATLLLCVSFATANAQPENTTITAKDSATTAEPSAAGETMSGQSTLTADQARQIAEDAFIYGYSLITTDITRVQMSNVSEVKGLQAPAGQFINVPRYPPADFRGVSAPNADTLYSLSWVDLTEPQVFSHPDMGKRFYLFELTDLWMFDLANSPSTRTASGAAANYLLTGPGWHGTVPAGMTQIPFATRYMVILGRTFADGSDADYKKVNALQAQLKITPLSAWGKPYTPVAPAVDPNPGFSMTDKPQAVINAMGATKYFNMMATLMCKDAPPAAQDAPMVARMARIGIVPCESFDPGKLDPAVRAAVEGGAQSGWARIDANQRNLGKNVNGWSITKGLGAYGTDYLKRATVAAFGWPANREKDAVYPYTLVDSTGATLNGAHKYTLTFAKGETPPIKGFWSITMYMIDGGWWFAPNPLNKFTVSPRNDLKTNADGSVTLYFQTDSPGQGKESNWLPAPKGDFILMLRMYYPQATPPSVLDGSWSPPRVMKAN
ncbi:DUF1254 domain-containing protein [Salinisphaera sp.]|uniref:DUF1254 domain-containing protein n=1 Tax=Salinisphaera sp. TaxID=1914330 RepID=UPI003C7D7FD1